MKKHYIAPMSRNDYSHSACHPLCISGGNPGTSGDEGEARQEVKNDNERRDLWNEQW